MKKQFKSFREARKFVHSQGLKNQIDWKQFCKSGKNSDYFPSHPDRTYKDQWKNWGDFLGTGTVASQNREYWSFNKARDYVRKLGLQTRDEWSQHVKTGRLAKEIPHFPDGVYKNKGWKGWGDWIGTEFVATHKRKYWSFNKARDYVRKLGLQTIEEWNQYTKSGKLPKEIPINLKVVYKRKGWNGFPDWLGYERKVRDSKNLWFFEKSRDYVRKLGLKSQQEWSNYIKSGKLPKEIPINPRDSYKDKGWIDFGDWLGTLTISNQQKSKKYLPWKDAKPLYQKFKEQYNLKNVQEWYDLVESGKTPANLPKYPDQIYTVKRVGKLLDD